MLYDGPAEKAGVAAKSAAAAHRPSADFAIPHPLACIVPLLSVAPILWPTVRHVKRVNRGAQLYRFGDEPLGSNSSIGWPD